MVCDYLTPSEEWENWTWPVLVLEEEEDCSSMLYGSNAIKANTFTMEEKLWVTCQQSWKTEGFSFALKLLCSLMTGYKETYKSWFKYKLSWATEGFSFASIFMQSCKNCESNVSSHKKLKASVSNWNFHAIWWQCIKKPCNNWNK